jgi:hypothetical protein
VDAIISDADTAGALEVLALWSSTTLRMRGKLRLTLMAPFMRATYSR